MGKEVFDYDNYKDFIHQRIENMPAKGRGVRLALAKHLSCQTAFISQVLNQHTNFSLEQSIKVASFFKLTKEESRYFLLLIQHERAGSQELREFLEIQMKEVQDKRADIHQRVNTTKFLEENSQHIYYSVWYYAAIHILLSIPEFQRPQKIAEHLKLSIDIVHEVIDFLCQTGLATQQGNKFVVGQTRIHLPKNSMQIRRHHTNWRNQAIQAIDRNLPKNLHYSSVISMGSEDISKIREIILKAIEKTREVIKESPEEQLQVLSIDFFNL